MDAGMQDVLYSGTEQHVHEPGRGTKSTLGLLGHASTQASQESAIVGNATSHARSQPSAHRHAQQPATLPRIV